MSDTESLDYLQSGFDPASLTVPRLRSILVQHDIAYPSSAKKAQLVEIFNESLVPKSRKILAARARARRTSKGITNAEMFDDEEEVMPPPAAPKPRSSPRKSSRSKTEDSEPETLSRTRSRSPVKKTPRPSKHSRPSDNDLLAAEAPSPVKRSTRKSTRSITPQIKAEDSDDTFAHRESSAFSSDNPFQSGSPSASGRTPSEGRRSLPPASSKRRSTPRQRTEEPEEYEFSPPTSKTFTIPVSKLGDLRYPTDSAVDIDETIEAGEEFTPDEHNELVHEQLTSGQSAVVPRPAKRQKTGVGKTPFLVVLLTLLGGYATWYRQEKLAVGYCGVGRPANQIIPQNIELPDWAVNLVEPQCEPCPQHAYCYGNLETRCEPDYILKPHPLAFGGVVPLVPTCEPDSEKARRVMAVADRAVEELRERRAKYECGELTDATGNQPVVEIKVEELKKTVAQKRRKGMTEQDFEDLWAAAIGEIEKREEVTSTDDGAGSHLLSSNSLARASFKCAIQRSARLAVERHRFTLALLSALAGALVYARYALRQHQTLRAAVPELVDLTLDRLALHATLHARDPRATPEPWIAVGQLRDDVLRTEHAAAKRERLWTRVRAVVELNSNVRSAMRESRSGEISRVWEWIGPLGALPEAGTPSNPRAGAGGRVSWGAYGDVSSPVSGSDPGPEAVQQRWEESRPIY